MSRLCVSKSTGARNNFGVLKHHKLYSYLPCSASGRCKISEVHDRLSTIQCLIYEIWYMYIPRTQMTHILVHLTHKMEGQPPKIKDKQVPGIYIYMGVSKNRGVSPQIINSNRLFPYFHHPFWGKNTTPDFWFNPRAQITSILMTFQNKALFKQKKGHLGSRYIYIYIFIYIYQYNWNTYLAPAFASICPASPGDAQLLLASSMQWSHQAHPWRSTPGVETGFPAEWPGGETAEWPGGKRTKGSNETYFFHLFSCTGQEVRINGWDQGVITPRNN